MLEKNVNCVEWGYILKFYFHEEITRLWKSDKMAGSRTWLTAVRNLSPLRRGHFNLSLLLF